MRRLAPSSGLTAADSPETFANAPVGLQVVAPHFRDEQAMGLARVISEALKSSHGRAT